MLVGRPRCRIDRSGQRSLREFKESGAAWPNATVLLIGILPPREVGFREGVTKSVNTLPLLLIVLGIFVVAYRYYSALLATRAFVLDDRNITPAHRFNDGHNYVP